MALFRVLRRDFRHPIGGPVFAALRRGRERICHTGREGLLELLGLVGVLEDQSVQVLLAADLELDVLGLLVLLDARSCSKTKVLVSDLRTKLLQRSPIVQTPK